MLPWLSSRSPDRSESAILPEEHGHSQRALLRRFDQVSVSDPFCTAASIHCSRHLADTAMLHKLAAACGLAIIAE